MKNLIDTLIVLFLAFLIGFVVFATPYMLYKINKDIRDNVKWQTETQEFIKQNPPVWESK